MVMLEFCIKTLKDWCLCYESEKVIFILDLKQAFCAYISFLNINLLLASPQDCKK